MRENRLDARLRMAIKDDAMDFVRRMRTFFLLAVVYFAAIFFAGAHLWSRSVLVLAIYVAFSAAMLITIAGGSRSAAPFRIMFDPASIAGLLFLIWTAVQLTPLPPGVLDFLSPQTLSLWDSTRIVGGKPPFSISLYPYMTANSLAFSLAVLLFYWSALYGLDDRRHMATVITGLIVLGNLEALYGMVQLVAGMPYALWWRKTAYETVATGTFIDRNHLAGFLSMLICLTIGYIWATTRDARHHRRRRRFFDRFKLWTGSLGTRGLVLVLSVVLMTAALLSTASRGGALSLMGGMIFMFGLVFTRYFKRGKTAVFIVVLFTAFIYAGYIASDRVLERFQFFSSDLENRLALARTTLTMGEDFPNTGSGLGTFEFVFPRYQKTSIESLVDYAHNDWVQLFAETGWPGFLILGGGFLWFMAACFIQWRKRHNPFSVGIGLGGMGAFVTIALHSLSEFNLHMPANALLLALLAALLYLALHSESRNTEEEHRASRVCQITLPRWTLLVAAVVAVLVEGTLALSVLRNWQADMLARTAWNSTIDAARPSEEDVVKAWRLAPGNATYWNMMAAAVPRKAKLMAEFKKQIPPQTEADIYFLAEAVKRNPTSWYNWRNLGWAALLRTERDPARYVPFARNAFDRARKLRPKAPLGHFEYGIAGLQAEWRQPGKSGFLWKEALQEALRLRPSLSTPVADQLALYKGPQGAAMMKELLPASYQSYRMAADYFFRIGFLDAGLDLLKEGEGKRELEAAVLWQEYRQKVHAPSSLSAGEGNRLLNEILLLDPRHPGALLAKERIISALKSQEQRGRRLGDLDEPAKLLSYLDGMENPGGSPTDIAYFKGRLAEEGKDYEAAVAGFRKALSLSPSYFPALLRLRALMAISQVPGTNNPGDERLNQQIKFYEMERVPANAWRWTGLDKGWPSWVAPFRVARGVNKIIIRFSGDEPLVSKLTLDGRLVDTWKESPVIKSKDVAVAPGEHSLRISQYRLIPPAPGRILPFEMKVDFVFAKEGEQ